MNRSFPSCSKSLFQSEAACEAIVMKMIFIVVQIELIFTLFFKVRVFGTQKWPIEEGLNYKARHKIDTSSTLTEFPVKEDCAGTAKRECKIRWLNQTSVAFELLWRSDGWPIHRLPVLPHFSSGIVEGARRERAWKSPHARKGNTRLALLAWGDFHARSRFARSTIPEEKWGTTRSLTDT